MMNYRNKLIYTVLHALLAGFLLSTAIGDSGSENTFDYPVPVNASDILPPNLITNEHFTVREKVTWFDGLHQFTVDTEYGSFEIWGEPMLRVRLQEFIAWKRLDNLSFASASAQAVGRTATRSISDLLMAFAHPITTIRGVPQGVSRLFRSVGRDIEAVAKFVSGQEHDESLGSLNRNDKDETSTATETANIVLGVNSSYRLWAEKAGVNPYTTNLALQEELFRVAKIDAYVGSGTWLIVPSISGSMAVVATVSHSIYKQNWREIVAANRQSLRGMGVGDKHIETFLGHEFVNLALSTLMIETLNGLEGVKDRALVVNQAILLETEAEAIWFTESLLMALWFHQNETSLAQMLPETLVPAALSSDNRVIVFSAADMAYWTEETATIIEEFSARYAKYSDRREAWIADQVSPRFVEGLGKLGWTTKSGIRSEALAEIPWGLQDNGN